MLKKILRAFFLAAIVILGVGTGVESFRSSAEIHSNDESVINWDDRLSNLIALIPLERGMVGYLSNEDIPGAAFDPDDASGEYILTQYAVAPLVLIRGAEQDWNLLNLDPETYEKWIQENEDRYRLVGSGGGIYLARRVAQ